MNTLERDWGCHWILASGSLVRFWKISELVMEERQVTEVLNQSLQEDLMMYEKNRVHFRYEEETQSRKNL